MAESGLSFLQILDDPNLRYREKRTLSRGPATLSRRTTTSRLAAYIELILDRMSSNRPEDDIASKGWKIEMSVNALHMNVPTAMVLVCSGILTGCGTSPATPASDSVPSGAVFSVSCEFAWADCYSEAQRRCTSGDFEEIDRNAIERVTADDRLNRSGPVRVDSMNQTITIRCK